MSESLFFPDKPTQAVNPEEYERQINQEVNKMYAYLHSHVSDGEVKTKLHDQLIWLQYQINYFHRFKDLSLFEENFNWVVSNFNHDLSVPEDQTFVSM
ncbi:MAG: hypothetical protein KFB93_06775 [Simkaniaceae bacterium]|nr:MAG: hypothetical protein KFB93_06775 [Simkaniaceae bacterium]